MYQIRFIIYLWCLLGFSACGVDSRQVSSKSSATPPPVPNSNSANVNSLQVYTRLAGTTIYSRDEIEKADSENEQFENQPAEFKNIDFSNFTYPGHYKIKDGTVEIPNKPGEGLGGVTVSLAGEYYLNLDAGARQEAVILLFNLGCGASCDGGQYLINFYRSVKGRARLSGTIPTGCLSCGCSLKSLIIKNRQVTVEQFGNCTKKQDSDVNAHFDCKFCNRGLTKSVYVFQNSKLVRISVELIDHPVTDLINFMPLISIGN